MTEYNILLATDNKYLPYAFVTCQSIINSIDHQNDPVSSDHNDNISNDTLIFTLALEGSVDTELLKEKCNRFISRNKSIINIQFYLKRIDENLFSQALPLNNSFSTYYRLIIDKLLDSSVEYALYLDCDLLVRNDIRLLFQSANIEQTIIAGALDLGVSYNYTNNNDIVFKSKELFTKPLHLSRDVYLNAGVTLFNLKRYREQHIAEKALSISAKYQFPYHDQDILNILIQNKHILNQTWNFSTSNYFNTFSPNYKNLSGLPEIVGFPANSYSNFTFSNNDFSEISKNPAICHFTCFKPWMSVNCLFANLPLNKELNAHLHEWYKTALEVQEFSEELEFLKYQDLYNHDFITCFLNRRIAENQRDIYKHNVKRKRDRLILWSAITLILCLQIICFIMLLQ